MKEFQRGACQAGERRRPHARGGFFARGQELIEFALIFPLALLFIFGAVDLGRVFYTVIVVSNAAREGARYGIAHGINPDTNYFIESEIKSKVKQESVGDWIMISDTDIAISCPAGNCNHGSPLRVTVTHDFVPIMTWILGQPSLAITRAAEMMIP